MLAQGTQVTGVVRPDARCEPGVHATCIDSLDSITPETFAGSRDPLAAFRATNVDGALASADAARKAGATRFVFVSGIKALANWTRAAR
nr:hypothetical protein [Paraburkholderia panacisoli]